LALRAGVEEWTEVGVKKFDQRVSLVDVRLVVNGRDDDCVRAEFT